MPSLASRRSPRFDYALRVLAVFGWMLAIFVFSHLPGGVRPDFKGLYTDKWVHSLVYLIFGGLLFRLMLLWKRPSPEDRFGRFCILAVIVMIYAMSDEIHQYFIPGRVFDLGDFTADTFGGLIAAALFFLPRDWQHRIAHLRPTARAPLGFPTEKTVAPDPAGSNS